MDLSRISGPSARGHDGSRARPPGIAHSTNRSRLDSIDVARVLGIVLVYHGHIVEQVMYLGDSTAVAQYKFIYWFHMPLFFLLSGLIAKNVKRLFGIGDFVKSRLAVRARFWSSST